MATFRRDGATCPIAGEEGRCGRLRESMRTNPLLQPTETGKVKQSMFHDFNTDRVFGVKSPEHPEGARDVMFRWQEHKRDPDDVPEPDFAAMNKLATHSGSISSKGMREFREDHLIRQKKGEPPKQPPLLPSDKNKMHTYGKPSSLKTEEEVRVSGKIHPTMKSVIQQAYGQDWVKTNQGHDTIAQMRHIDPASTFASRGHDHSKSSSSRPKSVDSFKLSKFDGVPQRVDTHLHDQEVVHQLEAMNTTTRNAMKENKEFVRST